ncbi:MAG: ATP-dependent protease, Lon family, partial [Selenomonadaceae bacterium]|nr:ATP-dependent protease, Lon family [Selenomonadaceae bacterium]
MGLLNKLLRIFHREPKQQHPAEQRVETELDREISALYAILVDIMGADRLVIQAGKMDALRYMRSEDPGERILAIRRILEENPTLGPVPKENEIPAQLIQLSERLADIMARRSVEDKIEKRITE